MWIEIYLWDVYVWYGTASRPARALWIEIWSTPDSFEWCFESRPARALWIEIMADFRPSSLAIVEAREGLVD